MGDDRLPGQLLEQAGELVRGVLQRGRLRQPDRAPAVDDGVVAVRGEELDRRPDVADRVGEEGAGWAVAQATLASERGLTLMELSYRMRGALWRIAELIRKNGRGEDSGVLRDFGKLATQVDAACAIADQFLDNRIKGLERVGDASVVKNTYSRALRAYSLLGVRLGGIDEQYVKPITFGDLNTGNWMADFMNSYAWTIAGGSEEVQRNIISERMLEMPREPKNWVL